MTVLRAFLALVLLGLVQCVTNAHAEEPRDYVVYTTASYHFDRSDKRNQGRGYNENNGGFGLERRFTDTWSVSAGFYENSFNRQTNYLFGGYTPWEIATWRVGATFGVVSGYDDGRLAPWLTGIATRDFGRLGVNAVFAPSALALQLKWRLD
jgi:hypothetical protein